jgi:hypothetical protein
VVVVVVFEGAIGRTRRKRRVEFMASEVMVMTVMCSSLLRRWNQIQVEVEVPMRRWDNLRRPET